MEPAQKKVEKFEGSRFPFTMTIQQDRFSLVDPHWHEHLEFIKILQGPVRFQIDSQSFDAETDEIYFINSCQVHSVTCLPGVSGRIRGMVFDRALLLSPGNLEITHLLTLFYRSNKILNKYGKSHPFWQELNAEIEKAYQEFTQANVGYEYNVLSSVYRIMISLLRLHQQDLNKHTPRHYVNQYMRLKPAIDYMEEHFADKVYMDRICEIINMNTDYFSSVFKKVFGLPPVQYLTKVRIDHAKRLLLDQQRSITEIAELSGFCNINYFDKVFKEQSGFTPMEFRKRYINQD
ncbi:helix-turn-helix domain-containing protein [Paenibacillus allorhizosphaerae]|uniref:Melibiose operon regulatory protein n=1 Tax=Paenibacillus allorhizosphaerae TaxID=2849866 RepID=A0ABN7TUL5_9BACL|nr:AraC family transcriptional regulator [Paenibacillus allorhizosphaerae]CAG7652445.1 Melibiose operon regulatory protein [Paenibacillus allorhizosphaerae]